MCYTFTLSLPQPEAVEKSKLYFVQKISFFLQLNCVTACILERKLFFLPCLFQLFLSCVSAEAQGEGEEVECEMEGLKPLRFLFWTVLECTFPVIKTFHPDLMTWLLLLACNFSLNMRILNLKMSIFWRTFRLGGGTNLFSSSPCSVVGFRREILAVAFPRRLRLRTW